jgi:hypothetical protein
MGKLKSLAAVLLLTLLVGAAAPKAFAGDMGFPGVTGDMSTPGVTGEMGTPGFTDGNAESPGVAGPQESPGFTGDLLAALIAALA